MLLHHRELFTKDANGDRQFLENIAIIVNQSKDFEFTDDFKANIAKSNQLFLPPKNSRAFNDSEAEKPLNKNDKVKILIQYLVLANNLLDNNFIRSELENDANPQLESKLDYSIHNDFFPIYTKSRQLLSQVLEDRNPELRRLAKIIYFSNDSNYQEGLNDYLVYKRKEVKGEEIEDYEDPIYKYWRSSMLDLEMPLMCETIPWNIPSFDSNDPEVLTSENGIINTTLVQGFATNLDKTQPYEGSNKFEGQVIPETVKVGLSGPLDLGENNNDIRLYGAHINRGGPASFVIVISNPSDKETMEITMKKGGIFSKSFKDKNRWVNASRYTHIGASNRGQSRSEKFNRFNIHSANRNFSGVEGLSAGFMLLQGENELIGDIKRKIKIAPGESRIVAMRGIRNQDQLVINIQAQTNISPHITYHKMPVSNSEKEAMDKFYEYTNKDDPRFISRSARKVLHKVATGNSGNSHQFQKVYIGRVAAISQAGDCYAEKNITILPRAEVEARAKTNLHMDQDIVLSRFYLGTDGKRHAGIFESLVANLPPHIRMVKNEVGRYEYQREYDNDGNKMEDINRYRNPHTPDQNKGGYHAIYEVSYNIKKPKDADSNLYIEISANNKYHENMTETQTVYQGVVELTVNGKQELHNISFTKNSSVRLELKNLKNRNTVKLKLMQTVNSTAAPDIELKQKSQSQN